MDARQEQEWDGRRWWVLGLAAVVLTLAVNAATLDRDDRAERERLDADGQLLEDSDPFEDDLVIVTRDTVDTIVDLTPETIVLETIPPPSFPPIVEQPVTAPTFAPFPTIDRPPATIVDPFPPPEEAARHVDPGSVHCSTEPTGTVSIAGTVTNPTDGMLTYSIDAQIVRASDGALEGSGSAFVSFVDPGETRQWTARTGVPPGNDLRCEVTAVRAI